MKRFFSLLVVLLVLLAGCQLGFAVTTTAISVQNLGSTPVIDATVAATIRFLTYRIPMTSDSALSFANDNPTFIVLFDSSGASATTTIATPQATLRTSFGDITLADLTCTTVSALGNIAFWQIPTRYNVAGKISIYTSASDYVNIAVFRLSDYPR
jgi:hypothetical protein